jgi:hypothetical protein
MPVFMEMWMAINGANSVENDFAASPMKSSGASFR